MAEMAELVGAVEMVQMIIVHIGAQQITVAVETVE